MAQTAMVIFFDLILSIGEQNVFTADRFYQVFNVEFTMDRHNSNEYRLIYYAEKDCYKLHPNVKKIEMRVPGEAGNPGGLIIIDLIEKAGISGRDVIQQFGDVSDLGVPYPEQPPDDPLYYVYQFKWGELSFGISRDEKESLTTVILDAYKKKTEKTQDNAYNIKLSFFLPEDADDIHRDSQSGTIMFKTKLDIVRLASYFRCISTEMGLKEYDPATVINEECLSVVFKGLPERKLVFIQVVDLVDTLELDLRQVSIRIESSID